VHLLVNIPKYITRVSHFAAEVRD